MRRALKLLGSGALGLLLSLYLYGRTLRRGALHVFTDVFLLYNRYCVTRGKPNLEWIIPGKPCPSEQFLAVYLTLKRVAALSKLQKTTLESLRQAVHMLHCLYASPGGSSRVTPVKARGVQCYWVVSEGVPEDAPVLLEAHGGGFISGSAKHHFGCLSHFSRDLHMRVLSVEYRLAPEHPLPAGVEDTVAVYEWLVQDLKVNPKSICVTGSSAGGGLTVLAQQAFMEKTLPLPACSVPLSPYVDLTNTSDSYEYNKAKDPMLRPEIMNLISDAAVGKYGSSKATIDKHDPRCSAINGEFRGLPPMFIMVGSTEILLDDSLKLAAKAKASGVDVKLEVADNMIHMYPLFAGVFPEADMARERIVRFVDEHIQRPTRQ